MSVISIDLNADLGEGAGTDAELMPIISSANIAAGGHAGDAETIRQTIRLALQHGVRIGVHPGFADPAHFGRRRLDLSVADLSAQLHEQVSLFARIAGEEGANVAYVKLHGGLANMASEDAALAETALRAVTDILPGLPVLALDNSGQVKAAEVLGLPVIREAYADRGYTLSGMLAPRDEPGAVLTDADAVVAQCLRLAQRGEIVATDGTIVGSAARSICLHGDTPGAVALAAKVRRALEGAGIEVAAP